MMFFSFLLLRRKKEAKNGKKMKKCKKIAFLFKIGKHHRRGVWLTPNSHAQFTHVDYGTGNDVCTGNDVGVCHAPLRHCDDITMTNP
jgi:hypothetical protein